MRDAASVLSEVLRTERLRIVASLIRTTGDWDLAEDAVAWIRRWQINPDTALE